MILYFYKSRQSVSKFFSLLYGIISIYSGLVNKCHAFFLLPFLLVVQPTNLYGESTSTANHKVAEKKHMTLIIPNLLTVLFCMSKRLTQSAVFNIPFFATAQKFLSVWEDGCINVFRNFSLFKSFLCQTWCQFLLTMTWSHYLQVSLKGISGDTSSCYIKNDFLYNKY